MSVLSEVYGDLTVSVPPRASMELRLTGRDLRAVKVASLHISDADVTTAPYAYYTVVTNRRGAVRMTIDGRSTLVGAHQSAVTTPGRPIHCEYVGKDTFIDSIVIERDALERELCALIGRTIAGPIDFEFAPVESAPRDPLEQAFATVRRALRGCRGVAGHPAMRRHLSGMLLTGLLLERRHPWSDAIFQPAPASSPRAISRVIEAIDEDPMAFVTVGDLARVANLSVRALEEGFRRYQSCPPMRYLRAVRLSRAHEDLTSSDIDEVTATTVAQRWGFAHYGRFVAEYRRRYGVSPADTLRR